MSGSADVRRLVVLAPMRVEATALRRGLPRATVLRTGMGRVKSLALAARIRDESFDHLVIAGVCGSLDNEFRVGHVIVPAQVSAPDVGAVDCAVDDDLLDVLRTTGLTVHAGSLVCAAKLVTNKRAVQQHRGSGAIAVDMESAWLATAAAGRPVTVVRVASDSPSQPLFHPGAVYWGSLSLRRLTQVGRALGRWWPSADPRARPTSA